MQTIPIPDRAQVEKVTATFENEILTVLLQIPINRAITSTVGQSMD